MRRFLVPLLFAARLLLPMPCVHPAEVRSSAIETTYVAVFRPHALADSPVKISGELKVAVYKIVSLSADGDTTGAAFIWDVTPEDVADPRDRGKDFDFTGPPGTYHVKLRVIQTKDGKFTINTARVTVVIGEPGPGPTPPVPPGPVDPLTQQFQAAYDAEPDKVKRVGQLATFTQGMGNAASLVNAKKPDGSFAVVSTKQLADAVHLAAETDVGKMSDGALAQVRKAVGVYLSGRLPPKNEPMDGAERTVATDAYGKVAAALKGVK